MPVPNDAMRREAERGLPTAEEIEARYDHSKPTSAHVRTTEGQG